jgi:hypothetical protein
MGLTNDIATALATKLAGIPGVRGSSATLPESIPVTPWAAVTTADADGVAASLETATTTFTCLLLVGRVGDDPRIQVVLRDLMDAANDAFRSAIQLGLSGSGVAMATLGHVTDRDTYSVAGEDYRTVTLMVDVQTIVTTTYTA